MNVEEFALKLLGWIGNHITFVIILFTFVIQITPIKWNPWTSLINWIGEKITKNTSSKLDGIIQKVNDIESSVIENEKDRIRWEVLEFANSCHAGNGHTKDEFEHIITLNKKYQRLLKETNDENGVFEIEYNYIINEYKERLEKNSFLTIYNNCITKSGANING